MSFKITNYPPEHVVTASEYNTALHEFSRLLGIGASPIITQGLALSAGGLDITVTKGFAFAGKILLGWIDYTTAQDFGLPAQLDADTTITAPASSTKYLVLQVSIDSLAAGQDTYELSSALALVSTPTTAFPTGNIVGEIVLGKITANATTATLDTTERSTDLAGLYTLLQAVVGDVTTIQADAVTLTSRVSALENSVWKFGGDYNPVTDTPAYSAIAPTSIKNKWFTCTNYSATCTFAGVALGEVFANDEIYCDGITVTVNHCGQVWGD